MAIVLLVLASTGILVAAYLSVAATVCVCLDRPSDRVAFLIRIIICWLLPVAGALINIRVIGETSELRFRQRWWLWPVRTILNDSSSSFSSSATPDIIASAERVLPGITSSTLPP